MVRTGPFLILLLTVMLACTPAARKPVVVNERYRQKATRENVFDQTLLGIMSVAHAVERQTSKEAGYIMSAPFIPPGIKTQIPTRYFIESRIVEQKEGDTTYYIPEVTLKAATSRDGRTWHLARPLPEYRDFLESDLQKRIMAMVAGYWQVNLGPNQYLGYVIIRDNAPIYPAPDRQNVLLNAHLYEYGDLQFKIYKPLVEFAPAIEYQNGLMRINFESKDVPRRIAWIDEDAVVVFKFTFVNTAGNAAAWKELYTREMTKGACHKIGLHKGTLENWDPAVLKELSKDEPGVVAGMTQEQVVAAIGPPDETRADVDAGALAENVVFIYKDAGRVFRRVFFVNGKAIKHSHD